MNFLDSLFNADTFWWILVVILFILSYVGLVVPAIPDVPLMMGGFLVYYFFIDGSTLKWWFWVTAVILMLLMMAVDYFSGGLAARKFGGSKLSMTLAPLGAILFIWLPLGIIIGPFITVFLVEVFQRQEWNRAVKIAMGTVVGFLSGVVIKIIALTGTKAWFFYLI